MVKKDRKGQFTKEDIQMAKKHIKRCLTLLAIKKIKTEATM